MAAAARFTWSWFWVSIPLWMASLTLPTFQSWHWALARHRGKEPDPNSGWWIVIGLAVATVVLGCTIGWHRRWKALWLAAALGALVMSVGTWVDYNHGWSGGEPLPEPGPFLMSFLILGVLLWTGAGLGVIVRTARKRPQPVCLGPAGH